MSAATPEHRSGGRADRWVGLVYHDVRPTAAASGGGPDRFAVPLASFELMLDAIAEGGYLGCSLEAARAERGTPRVAITFDDGTLGQYEHAFPALVARRMSATFYITTDWVGRAGYVTWEQLREMAAAGMSIQSHTRSHPFLSELNARELEEELRGSKDRLDAQLEQNTREIAFPGGDAPARRFIHLIEESGYTVSVGSRWGVNDDASRHDPNSFIRRCTVMGATTLTWSRRVVRGDIRLSAGWVAKETALRRLRSTLGASRYARWRRSLLDAVAAGTR